MSRNRSYCISRKSERKSSSNVEGSDQDGITYHRHLGFRSDNSLESTSLGIHVQSSNKIALEKNDREYQNTNPDASLLATNTEETDDALGRELLEARFEAPMDSKNKTKEQENMSDNSDTDYDEKLSDKESEEAEKKTEECQVPDVDSQTSMDRSLNLQNEEKEEPSRLFGLDNKDTDEGEMQSADHLNEVSSPEVTMLLNLDDRQEGNSYTEREIYETQLLQLQRQLVETMMKEQEATEKLTALENLKLDAVLKELEEEKAKTSELTARLEFMKNKMKNSPLKRANASRRRRSRNVETNESQEERPFGYDGERVKDENPHQDKPDDVTFLPADDTVFSFDEGHFAVASDTTCEDETAPPSKFAKLQEYKHVIIETIIDRLGDFVNEDSGTSKHKDDDDGDALSVITLKENINRCKSGAKPITLFVEPVIDILTWSSPVASVMTFLVYMFAVVHGYLLSLAILLVILQLSSNYFYASGLADKLGFKWKEEPPPHDDKKLSDRFQLVLQVAKKVQNALGEVADSLEKIKNLLMWQHPVTKKLFIVLCVGFVVSVLLDGATLFMLAGVGIGVKLFIVRPIYSKFPKVKKRYDNLARIWAELPTDTDLAKDAKHEKEEFYFNADAKDGPASPGSPKFGSPNFVTSWANLCVRMKIPLTEYPVPSWEEGHHCTLMTKDKPLAKLKHGKLFLTQNYLCFERYKFGASKNVIIKLKDTISVDKYKPMNIMPGTGMSIKVEFKGSYKPYIFGGLLTRDELYDSLIATCKAAKVPWAC